MGPTWQAIVPELVPRADLKSAVALNSLGINIARVDRPGGGRADPRELRRGRHLRRRRAELCVRDRGAAVVEAPGGRADDALSENFLGAFRAGLRYTRASRELHVVLLRAAVFFAVRQLRLGAAAAGRAPDARRRRRLLRHPAGRRGRGRHRRRAGDAAAACSASMPTACCCWPRCSPPR